MLIWLEDCKEHSKRKFMKKENKVWVGAINGCAGKFSKLSNTTPNSKTNFGSSYSS